MDRRNAVMLQGILILMGVLIPALATLRWVRDWHVQSINMPEELVTLIVVALIWTCLYLIRIGYFRLPVGMLIVSSLLLMGVPYMLYGLKAQIPLQLVHTFPLMLGGLLLRRRVLWLIFGAILVILVLGTIKDLSNTFKLVPLHADVWAHLLRSTLGFSLIAVILDRSVGAWRSTLSTANQRGAELIRARDRIEHEIIERERSHAQLAHAQKMKAVGLLASGIAHDFNNLLGVILGYAGRPSASHNLEVAGESLAGIRRAAKRGALITQRLLTFSRDDTAKVEIFDANTSLREVLPMMRQLFAAYVEVEIDVAEGELLIRLNPAEFELALLNIAANARDAMPQGGHFRISACISNEHPDYVTLSLSDNGIGMHAQQLARAIEPFYTSKAVGQGTGLGLSVVHRLVTEANGKFHIDSEPGVGTTIHMLFPRVTHAAAMPGNPHALNGVRVLLIEDDEFLQPLLVDSLRSAGCEVFVAATGCAAEALARMLDPVDVIVSDFDLPDTLADHLIMHLKPLQPTAALLIISAQRNADSRCRTRDPDAAFLQKPFTPGDLHVKLQAMLGPRND